MVATEVQKTSLWNRHKTLGGRMVEFAGWSMPAFYSNVKSEHEWVRSKCGIFDVSHMGQFFVKGPDAESFLNFILTNNCESLKEGGGQYTLLLNEEGGIVDDWIIYKLAQDSYLACVNASRIQADWTWIVQLKNKYFVQSNLTLENASSVYSQIAIQGPDSRKVTSGLLSRLKVTENTLGLFQDQKYMSILPLDGVFFGSEKTPTWIARTGYTGELGYELYIPQGLTEKVWDELLEDENVKAIGLGARDTLRLEVCYHLYGQDMDETTMPQDVDLTWVLKLKKNKKFCGQPAIEAELEKRNGQSKSVLCGFRMDDKGIARSGMEVFAVGNEASIGKVTSAGPLPSAGFSGGMCKISRSAFETNGELFIDLRGEKRKIKIVDKPLYHAKVKS